MRSPVPRRSAIRLGATVLVVLKQDQPTGTITLGVVKRILTRSASHPHGIKVLLENGLVGRVQQLVNAVDQGPVNSNPDLKE